MVRPVSLHHTQRSQGTFSYSMVAVSVAVFLLQTAGCFCHSFLATNSPMFLLQFSCYKQQDVSVSFLATNSRMFLSQFACYKQQDLRYSIMATLLQTAGFVLQYDGYTATNSRICVTV